MNKPFETYFGGKEASGTYQKIINCIRPHQVFISGFLGNDAVVRMKKPSQKTIGIDINPEVITRWKTVNYPNIELVCANGIEYLSEMTMLPGTIVYLDPPYPLLSRRSSRKVYPFEMSDQDHQKLLDVATRLKCDVLISTYYNHMYAEALKDWKLITFQSATRGGVATEHLYMNFDNREGVLHEYTYLGEDFIERQRIKRKINRWVNKLKGLPPSEMQAILQAINSDLKPFSR